jgi:hypothetical protein
MNIVCSASGGRPKPGSSIGPCASPQRWQVWAPLVRCRRREAWIGGCATTRSNYREAAESSATSASRSGEEIRGGGGACTANGGAEMSSCQSMHVDEGNWKLGLRTEHMRVFIACLRCTGIFFFGSTVLGNIFSAQNRKRWLAYSSTCFMGSCRDNPTNTTAQYNTEQGLGPSKDSHIQK